MRLGCTTGVLYHWPEPQRDIITGILDAGARALELSQDTARWFNDDPASVPLDLLRQFEHVSLHAPLLTKSAEDTELLLASIRRLHTLHPLAYVVIHPNAISDIELLRDPGFPVAFENMDVRNTTFTTPASMRALLDAFPHAGMVLDVNHVWTHDHTMKLADEFYAMCGDRIVGVHVSGYEIVHDPLFRTHQDEIIDAIRDVDLPMIIESQLQKHEIHTELEYIRVRLNARVSNPTHYVTSTAR
jgi:hypothetical protein